MAGFDLKLIVGLGNPGAEYARTRHNAGFWFVDALARRHGGTFKAESRHQGELARVRIAGEDIWLLKPMTFMNRSGAAVQSMLSFYKLDTASILIGHDEIDLPVGVLRLKEGGGHGGHNGLRDLIANIGDGFWRLRFGVGHPGEREAVIGHVLARASAEEDKELQDVVQIAVDLIPELIQSGPQRAMHRLHTQLKARDRSEGSTG